MILELKRGKPLFFIFVIFNSIEEYNKVTRKWEVVFMNRQVVSFLSLFGLVLVLSVYYILLPTNLFINVPSTDKEVGTIINPSQDVYFETLFYELDAKHQEVIDENLAIVVSSEVSNQQKEVALNAILSEKEIISLENTLVGLIKEEGYSNVYVEYLENSIKVVVKAEEVTNEQAAAIFTIVFENSETNLIPELEIIS